MIEIGLAPIAASATPTVAYVIFRVIDIATNKEVGKLSVREDQCDTDKIEKFVNLNPDNPIMHALLIGVCYAALSQTGLAEVGPRASIA